MRATKEAQRCYEGEDTLGYLQAKAEGGAQVVVEGVPLQLEGEAWFMTLADVQAFVTRVVSNPEVIAAFGHRGMVKVRRRQTAHAAHYEHGTKTIALHDGGEKWAMREMVLTHELAHHFAGRGAHHGPEFQAVNCKLIEIVIGPQMALAQRLLYAASACK